ncbi:MAG: hypothetical protein IT379_14070 [Deltaproteobacteria bacterium]|nr:hypothetical protein [Deltaproteobacteria bacterium]
MKAEEIVALLESLVPGQEARVLALARRLRPDVTVEDVKNPHDFPELDDRDFQFEDGKLAGLWTAIYAVRAELRRRSDAA